MTPSRSPPLPICSGWPSSSETFSSSSTPVVRMRTRSGSSSKRRATSAAGSPQRTRIAALQGLVLEHRADQPAQRGGAAADRDGLGRVLDLDPLEDVVDAVADLADLRRRGRVGGDQLVGEDAGADPPGAHLLGAAGDGAEDHLGRAAADVDDADRALDRVAERLGRADEGEPPLLLVAEHLDRDAGGLADRRGHLARRWRPRAPPRWRRRGSSSAPSSRASRTWVATTSQTSSTFSARIAPSSSSALLIRV